MSKSRTAEALPSFGFDRTGVPVTEAVIDLARQIWPAKTARQLASRCGVNHRSVEFWMAQRSGMSSEAVVNLLRSDKGYLFLRVLMGGAPGSWWAKYDAEATAIDVLERVDALRDEIAKVRGELR